MKNSKNYATITAEIENETIRAEKARHEIIVGTTIAAIFWTVFAIAYGMAVGRNNMCDFNIACCVMVLLFGAVLDIGVIAWWFQRHHRGIIAFETIILNALCALDKRLNPVYRECRRIRRCLKEIRRELVKAGAQKLYDLIYVK